MKPTAIKYTDVWGRVIVANDSDRPKWYMSHGQAMTAADKAARLTGTEHWPFQPPKSSHYVVARGVYDIAMPR